MYKAFVTVCSLIFFTSPLILVFIPTRSISHIHSLGEAITRSLAGPYSLSVSHTCSLSHSHPLTHWPLGDFNLILESWFFKLILVNGGWDISYEIALRRMPQDLTDDKSTLVQVMAWCRQATSHYLGQCWPRSMSPFGVTRPQWVNILMYFHRQLLISLTYFQSPTPLFTHTKYHWMSRLSICTNFKVEISHEILNPHTATYAFYKVLTMDEICYPSVMTS